MQHQKSTISKLEHPFVKKGEDVKNGDMVEIASEGKEQPDKFNPGAFQTIILVKTKAGLRYVNLNQTSINILIDVFNSSDDKEWVGKQAKIILKPGMYAGKKGIALYLVGETWELDEYGEPVDTSAEGDQTLPEDNEDLPEPPF